MSHDTDERSSKRPTAENVVVDPSLLGTRDPAAGEASGPIDSQGSRPRRPTSQVFADADRPTGRRVTGMPPWGWPLLALFAAAVALIVLDVRNRARLQLVCAEGEMELRRGRRLPWPFGFEPVGGLFQHISLPAETPCDWSNIYSDRIEAETAFLDALLAHSARLLDEQGADLKQVRQQLMHALRITRTDLHQLRRGDVEAALADVAYRMGRSTLTRIEGELRTTLSHLQEAQRWAGDRYDDLEQWIEHLETLLRTVAPSPGTTGPPRPSSAAPPSGAPSGQSFPGPPVTSPQNPVSSQPDTLLPGPPVPPPAASEPTAAPDAGQPSQRSTPGGSGILM